MRSNIQVHDLLLTHSNITLLHYLTYKYKEFKTEVRYKKTKL